MIRFVHLSDTHLLESADAEKSFCGVSMCPYPLVEKVVRRIAQVPFPIDFVVHTGDIVSYPNEQGYRDCNSLMKTIGAPVYYVAGNHDDRGMIKKYLTFGKHCSYNLADNQVAYHFDKELYRCIFLDGRGPDEIDPHGVIDEHQMLLLQQEIERGDKLLLLFLHFSFGSYDSPWIDSDMGLLNGEEFHGILKRCAGRIRGVFTGHLHRAVSMYRDGILYSTAASSVMQFLDMPHEKDARLDPDEGPGFNVVTVSGDRTLVKRYTL